MYDSFRGFDFESVKALVIGKLHQSYPTFVANDGRADVRHDAQASDVHRPAVWSETLKFSRRAAEPVFDAL
jgi:hypothetical protein